MPKVAPSRGSINIRLDDRQVIDASAVYNEYLERLRSESILNAEIVDR